MPKRLRDGGRQQEERRWGKRSKLEKIKGKRRGKRDLRERLGEQEGERATEREREGG